MSKRSRKSRDKEPRTSSPSVSPPAASDDAAPESRRAEVRAHLRVGWWALLVFLSLGIGLEALHGFKADLYLNVENETRRLMWTLAHAHGVLLALVQIGFAATVHLSPGWTGGTRALASRSLMAALVLMPLGFFLGGVIIYGGDPGLGVLLVPIGAVALFVGVLLTARGVGSDDDSDDA